MSPHRRRQSHCKRCGYRDVQEHGFCRTCAREAASLVAVALAERRAQLEALRPVRLPPRPPRQVVVGGHRYEVVWDGT
jgi:uncharacterized OB-fold protein